MQGQNGYHDLSIVTQKAISFLKEWWWVALCLLCTYTVHLNAGHHKRESISRLHEALSELECMKSDLMDRQVDLRARIASQDDPEWVAMMLMQELGVVPEGHTKVHFVEE